MKCETVAKPGKTQSKSWKRSARFLHVLYALQKTLLLSYFLFVYITFVSILLNKVFWILSFFSSWSFQFCIVIPHQSVSLATHGRKWRGVSLPWKLWALVPTTREGQIPTKADHGSNIYTTATLYRKRCCASPARWDFEPWFICGTVFSVFESPLCTFVSTNDVPNVLLFNLKVN